MNGERHKAIEHYRRAITIAPNDFHAHYNLGLAQWSLGHVEEAIALFQQAITIDPNSIVARQNLAAARAAAQEH